MNAVIPDVLDAMIAWEGGQLDREEELALFSDLLSDGLVWQLQGCYGRRAAQLIRDGLISKEGVIL